MLKHVLGIQAKTYIPVFIIGLIHLFLQMQLLNKMIIDGLILVFFTIVLVNSYKKIENKGNCLLLDKPRVSISLMLVLFVNLIIAVIVSMPATLVVYLITYNFNGGLINVFSGVLVSFSWILVLIAYGFVTTEYCVHNDGILIISGIWRLDIKYSQISRIYNESRRFTFFHHPILSERMFRVFLGNRPNDFVCIELQTKSFSDLSYSKIYLTPSHVKQFLALIQEKRDEILGNKYPENRVIL